MSNAKWEVLVSRAKSFAWRAGAFLVVAFLNWLSQELVNWNLPPEWMTIAGLLLGEVTKYVNSNLPWLKSQEQ